MLRHTHEVSTAPRVAPVPLQDLIKTGGQINSTEPMYKQTNRFLLRKELRKLAKWVQALRRKKACSRSARALRVCLSASESVYGLALSGSHYGTFEYTCADSNGSGPPKASNVGGPGRGERWATLKEGEWQWKRGEGGEEKTSKMQRKEREAANLSSTLPRLFASAADVVVRKGGEKNLHKVIIIHMNADQNSGKLQTHTYTHKHSHTLDTCRSHTS